MTRSADVIAELRRQLRERDETIAEHRDLVRLLEDEAARLGRWSKSDEKQMMAHRRGAAT